MSELTYWTLLTLKDDEVADYMNNYNEEALDEDYPHWEDALQLEHPEYLVHCDNKMKEIATYILTDKRMIGDDEIARVSVWKCKKCGALHILGTSIPF